MAAQPILLGILSLEARAFTEGDYPIIAEWYKARGFPLLPLHMLPQNGAVVEGAAAGFLYLTDSPIAWMEWIVTNPEASGRGEAIKAVVEHLHKVAKDNNCAAIMCTVNSETLISVYKDCGFDVTDVGMTNMCRRV
jgi:GNAT superfamily N-acetyltransferase